VLVGELDRAKGLRQPLVEEASCRQDWRQPHCSSSQRAIQGHLARRASMLQMPNC
jgi:hypothetical protein